MRDKWLLIGSMAIFSSIAGCASAQRDVPITSTQLHQAPYCGISEATSVAWIDTLDQWEAAIEGLRQSGHARFAFDATSSLPVVYISMGQKPSSGYRLDLAQDLVLKQGDQGNELHIPMKVLEPAKGSMTLSVITNPCLVLSIPSDQSFKKIKLLDQSGETLAETQVN